MPSNTRTNPTPDFDKPSPCQSLNASFYSLPSIILLRAVLCLRTGPPPTNPIGHSIPIHITLPERSLTSFPNTSGLPLLCLPRGTADTFGLQSHHPVPILPLTMSLHPLLVIPDGLYITLLSSCFLSLTCVLSNRSVCAIEPRPNPSL